MKWNWNLHTNYAIIAPYSRVHNPTELTSNGTPFAVTFMPIQKARGALYGTPNPENW